MPRIPDRRLAPDDFSALQAEVIRAAVELSDEQLMTLIDALHSMRRRRHLARPVHRSSGWLEEESPYLS